MPHPPLPRRAQDTGQATTEYGLVIMLAGTIALGAVLWSRDSDIFTGLIESVIERLTGDL